MKPERFFKQQLTRHQSREKHAPAACAEIDCNVEGIIYHED